MSDLSTFEQYYKLADQLIEKSSKDDIAECARLLALNVAHYQSKYGELPIRFLTACFQVINGLCARFTSCKFAERF